MTPQDLDALEKRLRDLRIVLKSGDYDGADLMRAWCAMIDAADMIAELKEAYRVIDRLGSSEAFDMPRAIDGPLATEMRARMDYARAFLARNGEGEG